MRLQRFPAGEPCGVDTKPLFGFSCAKNPPTNITACGECGILSDSSFPVGVFLGPPSRPQDPAISPIHVVSTSTSTSPSVFAFTTTHVQAECPYTITKPLQSAKFS